MLRLMANEDARTDVRRTDGRARILHYSLHQSTAAAEQESGWTCDTCRRHVHLAVSALIVFLQISTD